MHRREFIRIVGGVGLSSAIDPGYVFGGRAEGYHTAGVLVEAAAFARRGGWKLDTQHVQQMGGCYLLAHGLGRPVENARSSAKLPEAGRWHVWVRTRDWCPGDWPAPGRFKLLVDGKALPTELGTEAGWAWQYAGVHEAPRAAEVGVELVDQTGFDGRCDAVYFCREAKPRLPNENLADLAAWKDTLSGRAGRDIPTDTFDLVVVGGGIAGCAAALAARSQGLRVALVQDRPVFGGNASEEVRVHTIGIPGKGAELISTIDTPHYPNGHPDAQKAQAKREATMRESGVDLFAGHIACGLEKEGKRIVGVEAREATSGLLRRFRAPVFVDATGDGWLGYWAGAEWRYGRESRDEFNEGWKRYGELWSPEEADGRVMGTSVLWYSEQTDQPTTFPEVPWAMPVAKQHVATEGEWYWEYSADELDQVRDAEQIRDHLLRAIYGSFANAKKAAKNAKRRLAWVAYVGGKRESRRLVGDYLYTQADVMEKREFPDTVVEEIRPIDLHYQRKEKGHPVDFLSEAMYHRQRGMYYVPFRCLYSRDIENLMMAGRCFSCSHVGLGGPRVMKTCGQMGIATGYAAALCKQHDATPRDVGRKHIGELRKLIGYA